ncbi:hypothetical protein FOVG_14998 [Fusarium oxysporum f. sp. pisi HDV247]|uniref:DUF676 domain-containing protein n=1 Tax=Fusarium oxysporum f. sp. pisi HDV247 TaxID=1080344 RepID=W9P122_FUSOX|nr:hypothetical protein FOVG_14998 [Fusarium oxysporum f. sp. pisi HDV247]WKT41979.1 hypothetical protein QSH57_006785 [Fusarium oxysporum f. sp. vasinfectum]
MPTPVKDTGFTTLQDPSEPELDIVFVHGLQGHPRKSWTFHNEAIETKRPGKFLTIMSSLRWKSPTPTPPPEPQSEPDHQFQCILARRSS